MGIRTSHLDVVPILDEVIGHAEVAGHKKTVVMPATKLAAQLDARRGPSLATLAELEADLDWGEGAEAKVWGDASSDKRGIYRKSGVSGQGQWTRIGPLPETDITHSLRVPDEETIEPFPQKADRAGTVMMFDADGQPTAGPTASDISNAQAHAQGITAARDAAEAAKKRAEEIAADVQETFDDAAQKAAQSVVSSVQSAVERAEAAKAKAEELLAAGSVFYGLYREDDHLILENGTGDFDTSKYLCWDIGPPGLTFSIDQNGHLILATQEG
ncbi:hypothetical protein TRICHSKD4_1011 [Roseibium sp. TrichSKD4]|uniref:hypothetical protein n=1 Tax=Roseibium sp. TrichSKD4 TaxID=744980 RepID=UPI0001E5637A|nr:hypothetical protein [Roseibium sp. TrichSKD4]EFO33892.1 hypothetical protein TRICHSKD4_1011 [Roseibium sp. TrichSKD4]